MAESPDTTYTAEKRRDIELALRRFINGADAEALHDLRVALRRLTSLLRIFDTSQDSSYQLVRSMLKTTNRARDLEVFLLFPQQFDLSLPELEEAWQNQLADEIRQLRQTLPTRWQIAATTLPDISDDEQNLRQRAAKQLQSDILRLQRRRAKLCHNWKDNEAHKLRISGKQVRYLLELFTVQNTDIDQCITKMKSFQDLLGEYHDCAALLIDPAINSDELPTVATTLTERMKQLHKTFTANHCLSSQMDHTLLRAMQALQTLGRKENNDVV